VSGIVVAVPSISRSGDVVTRWDPVRGTSADKCKTECDHVPTFTEADLLSHDSESAQCVGTQKTNGVVDYPRRGRRSRSEGHRVEGDLRDGK